MAGDVTWAADMPAVYDRKLGTTLFAPYALDVVDRVAALAPSSVLELAAGSGILTRQLVARLPDVRVVATDLAPAMVEWAAQRVPGAEWRAADAQALPFPDDGFDVVVCQFGAMFFPDKVGAYAEAARVLVPGGRLLLAIWDAVERSTFASALGRALATVLPVDTPDFVTRVPHGYCDPARIEADLRAAGLRPERFDAVGREGDGTARDVAEGFCLGTPLRFALAERGDLATLTDRVAAQMTVLLGDGTVTGEMAAFVVVARRPA